MSESLTNQWKVTKRAVRGKGVVVAQNSRAAQAGFIVPSPLKPQILHGWFQE